MDELGLKIVIAEHVSRLRELAKEAEDFASRIHTYASDLDDTYRHLRERTEQDSKEAVEKTLQHFLEKE